MAVRLLDTSRCPVGDRCLTCGSDLGLSVAAATTQVGVVCFTQCTYCQDATISPRLSVPQAVGLSLDHCEHLGITADQMDRLMDTGR